MKILCEISLNLTMEQMQAKHPKPNPKPEDIALSIEGRKVRQLRQFAKQDPTIPQLLVVSIVTPKGTVVPILMDSGGEFNHSRQTEDRAKILLEVAYKSRGMFLNVVEVKAA